MASKRRVTKYCIIATCFNRSTNDPDLTFFTLPKDDQRRQQWLLLADRDDLLYRENLNIKSYCICAAHFDKSCIKTIKHLKDNALPTYFLPKQTSQKSLQSEDERLENIATEVLKLSESSIGLAQSSSASNTNDDMVNKSTQTSKDLSKQIKIKRKPNKLQVLKNKRRRLEEAVIKIEKDLESKNASLEPDSEDDIIRRFRALFDWQNKIKNTFEGYEAKYQLFTVNLYNSSPQTYQCLQTLLNLPDKRTLNKFKFNTGTELDQQVIDSLSFKMKSLPEKAKYCTICIDKLELKPSLYYDIKKDKVTGFSNINGKISPEIACYAYVIMLQGIYLNWKQPIAYSFLTKCFIPYFELNRWISDIIQKLFESGIEVKAIISNQEYEFNDYANITQKVTVNEPYFFVNGRKIYYIFDVPHLLKCTRDHLISKDFVFQGNKISWDHVRTLFDCQKDKNFTLMPKITKAHVQPNGLQRKNLQHAAQIFSNTVSAALETFIDFGKIAEKSRGTAKFLKAMNDIFDVLNSSNIKSHKQLQTAFCMSEEQMKVLEEAQHMFANMASAVHDVTQKKTFLNFQITIKSTMMLFKDLESEGYQCLFTRRLNNDNIDIFFGAIKQEAGSSKPTPIQFTRAFSKLFSSYMLTSSPLTKREPDIFQLLLNADDINDKVMTSSEETRTSLVYLNGDIDYRLNLPNEHDMAFVASFLLLKCSEQHSDCIRLTGQLKSAPRLINDTLSILFTKYIESWPIFKKMRQTSAEFDQSIEMLDAAFTQNFRKCVTGNVGSTLFELLKKCNLPMLYCSCFPVDYLIKLFVRLRIYKSLKYNNCSFKHARGWNMMEWNEIQTIKVRPLALEKI